MLALSPALTRLWLGPLCCCRVTSHEDGEACLCLHSQLLLSLSARLVSHEDEATDGFGVTAVPRGLSRSRNRVAADRAPRVMSQRLGLDLSSYVSLPLATDRHRSSICVDRMESRTELRPCSSNGVGLFWGENSSAPFPALVPWLNSKTHIAPSKLPPRKASP